MNEVNPSGYSEVAPLAALTEQQLRRIFNNLIVAILQVNTGGHIIYANIVAERILRLQRDRILRRYVR